VAVAVRCHPLDVAVRVFMGGVGGFIILLGKKRFGDSGGSNRQWYAGYYKAKGVDKGKGLGKEAQEAYIRQHGPPPNKGNKEIG
jgi:hypothetical protein